MDLLICAYWNEAYYFIERFGLQKLKQSQPDLYSNDNAILCICGEGLINAAIKISGVLAIKKNEIKRIVNFGIAGSLGKTAEIGNIYSIRTVYGAEGKEPRFHSFTSADERASVDCISAGSRVETSDRANALGRFAPCVDMELWSIAKACKEYNLPWISLKYISDDASQKTELPQIQKISEIAGKALCEFYVRHYGHKKNPIADIKYSLSPDENDFHITRSQRHILDDLTLKMRARFGDNFLNEIDLASIKKETTNKKRRTSRLIEALHQKLNPFDEKLRARLDEVIEPLKKAGFKADYDKNLENPSVSLYADIGVAGDTEKLIRGLQEYDHNELIKIFNGKIDAF